MIEEVGLNRGFLGFLCSDDRVGESDRFFDTNGGEAPPKGAGARSTSSSLDVSWLIYFQGAYGGCQRKKSSELDVLFGLFLLSLARSSECVGLFAGCSERTTARRYVHGTQVGRAVISWHIYRVRIRSYPPKHACHAPPSPPPPGLLLLSSNRAVGSSGALAPAEM